MKNFLCLMLLSVIFISKSESKNDGFKLLSDTGIYFHLTSNENNIAMPANYAPYILWNKFDDNKNKIKPTAIIKNKKKDIQYKNKEK